MIWGAIALLMIVFGATLMKDAPKQEVKTSNGVVEKDYTLAESMRKTAVLDVSGNVPDRLHERPVRDWGSERYRPKSGTP